MAREGTPGEGPGDGISDYDEKYVISREEELVRIQCPSCGKIGNVSVDKEMVLSSPGKVMRYPVVKGMVCEHAFMITIDVNFKAR